MLLHATAASESELKADSGANLYQQCTGPDTQPTGCVGWVSGHSWLQLSYIPALFTLLCLNESTFGKQRWMDYFSSRWEVTSLSTNKLQKQINVRFIVHKFQNKFLKKMSSIPMSHVIKSPQYVVVNIVSDGRKGSTAAELLEPQKLCWNLNFAQCLSSLGLGNHRHRHTDTQTHTHFYHWRQEHHTKKCTYEHES